MLATLAAALALAVSAPPRAAPVTLAFAWPDGVEGTRSERAESMGSMMGQTASSEAALRVARAGEEWRVRLAGVERGGGPAPAQLVLVAGPDGACRRLEGDEAFRAALIASMRSEAGFVWNLVPGMKEAQEQLATRFVEAERARWREDVARWAGLSLVPGATAEETRPAAGPRAVAARVRYGLRRTLPCPGDAPRTCVELWASAETDEAARRAACDAAGDALAKGQLAAESSELTVIAEPDTLLPHRSTGRATFRKACADGIGLGGDATESHERSYAWRGR